MENVAMKNAQNGKAKELFALVIVLVFVQLWFCPWIHLALSKKLQLLAGPCQIVEVSKT
jgi:hypothetical protein